MTASRPESIDARPRHNAVPPPVAYFRSREEIVHAAIASMMRPLSAANGAHRGALLLRGVAGVGKSEVARYVCSWFSERGHFTGLYFVDGDDVADDLRDSLNASADSAWSVAEFAIPLMKITCLFLSKKCDALAALLMYKLISPS